ncbi:hypothetical protein RHMOL_Rhmol06G0133300 [Rhododendron molle]|uniref:Uncharacterized protein n=1 Tax=Rhododendron molle TaxID=49168 RepID=A0ACC0NCN5_RHOML|nr:hypothetical protein RHMOL_Rhmol06G0133300 [Rhododendron molle]
MSTGIVRSLSLSLSLSKRWYAGDPHPFLGRLLDFRNPIPPHPLSLPRPFPPRRLAPQLRLPPGQPHRHPPTLRRPTLPHLLPLNPFFPNRLSRKPAHTFVGVGIHKDVEKLTWDYGLTVANAVDLRVPAAEAYGVRELRNAGLAVLARQVLGADGVKPRREVLKP